MSKKSQKSLTLEADNDQSPIEKDEKSTKVHQLPSDELITDEVKLRMEVIQSLIEPCDRSTYSTKKKEAADCHLKLWKASSWKLISIAC